MIRFVVAIDGPAAAGKGTIARAISSHFGFAHLDTGLLYRCVTRDLLSGNEELDETAAARLAARLDPESVLDHASLRSPEVSRQSSRIAAMPGVRQALLDVQRRFAEREGGAVLDGRDIGTVIVPDADVKLFVTASDSVRARRRFDELSKADVNMTLEEVQADLKSRDRRDRTRGLAALRMSDDALLLDTSELSIDQAVNKAIEAVSARYGTGLESGPAFGMGENG